MANRMPSSNEMQMLMVFQRGKSSMSLVRYQGGAPAAAGAAAKAPAAYADILDEYAQALTGAERSTEASNVLERADALRGDHPGKRSITDRTPYGKFCRLI